MTSKKQPKAEGKGEYENQNLYTSAFVDPEDRSVAHKALFDAIAEVAPETLHDLREKVLPAFVSLRHPHLNRNDTQEEKRVSPLVEKWAEKYQLVEPKRWDTERRLILNDLHDAEHAYIVHPYPSRVSVSQLFRPWILPVVWNTLFEWAHDPTLARHPKWLYPNPLPGNWSNPVDRVDVQADGSVAPVPPPETAFRTVDFSAEGWRPRSETPAAGEKRILAEVADGVRKYLQSFRSVLLTQPHVYSKAPKKIGIDHFRWLVRRQVQGWSPSTIARTHQSAPDEPAVKAGIRSAAELLIGQGWQLWMNSRRRKPMAYSFQCYVDDGELWEAFRRATTTVRAAGKKLPSLPPRLPKVGTLMLFQIGHVALRPNQYAITDNSRAWRLPGGSNIDVRFEDVTRPRFLYREYKSSG